MSVSQQETGLVSVTIVILAYPRLRWHWRGMAGVLLAAGVIMTGCSDDSSPAGAADVALRRRPHGRRLHHPRRCATAAPAGTGGMTIRYLDSDGKIKTVRVEDFPR